MLSFDYFYEVSLFFKHFKITQINKCYLWLFRRSGCCLWGVCDFTFLSWYLRSLCYPDKHLFFLLVIVWGKCKSVCPRFPGTAWEPGYTRGPRKTGVLWREHPKAGLPRGARLPGSGCWWHAGRWEHRRHHTLSPRCRHDSWNGWPYGHLTHKTHKMFILQIT